MLLRGDNSTTADVLVQKRDGKQKHITALRSQAESTAHFLIDRGAVGIGKHTAGANGDVTNFNLPGNVNLTFSGHKTSMQRTGILPHIKVEPTIKGIRAGKDETLERAVSYLQKGK